MLCFCLYWDFVWWPTVVIECWSVLFPRFGVYLCITLYIVNFNSIRCLEFGVIKFEINIQILKYTWCGWKHLAIPHSHCFRSVDIPTVPKISATVCKNSCALYLNSLFNKNSLKIKRTKKREIMLCIILGLSLDSSNEKMS